MAELLKLPEFEILQMCIIGDDLSFIVHLLCVWNRDHVKATELTSSAGGEVALACKSMKLLQHFSDFAVTAVQMCTCCCKAQCM